MLVIRESQVVDVERAIAFIVKNQAARTRGSTENTRANGKQRDP